MLGGLKGGSEAFDKVPLTAGMEINLSGDTEEKGRVLGIGLSEEWFGSSEKKQQGLILSEGEYVNKVEVTEEPDEGKIQRLKFVTNKGKAV